VVWGSEGPSKRPSIGDFPPFSLEAGGKNFIKKPDIGGRMQLRFKKNDGGFLTESGYEGGDLSDGLSITSNIDLYTGGKGGTRKGFLGREDE